MATASLARDTSRPRHLHIWLPLVLMSLGVVTFLRHLPPWQFMWSLALAQFLGFKWLSLSEYTTRASHPIGARAIAYLLMWPGMDADAFFDASAPIKRPALRQWIFAAGKILGGLFLLFEVAPRYLESVPLLNQRV